MSNANFRCCDKIEETLTASILDAKSLELGSPSSFIALSIVCKICKGSPWLTTRIAHLQNAKTGQITFIWFQNNHAYMYIGLDSFSKNLRPQKGVIWIVSAPKYGCHHHKMKQIARKFFREAWLLIGLETLIFFRWDD